MSLDCQWDVQRIENIFKLCKKDKIIRKSTMWIEGALPVILFKKEEQTCVTSSLPVKFSTKRAQYIKKAYWIKGQ